MAFAETSTITFGEGTPGSGGQTGTLARSGSDVTISGLGAGAATLDGASLLSGIAALQVHIAASPSLGSSLDLVDDPASAVDAQRSEYVEPVAPSTDAVVKFTSGANVQAMKVDTMEGLRLGLLALGF